MDRPDWRQIMELPKLCIPSGEAWVRNMTMISWVKDVALGSTTVSVEFSEYVSKAMRLAKEMYEYQRKNPRVTLDKPQPVPPSLREFNCKLCVLLTPAVPESIKQRVLEDADDTMHMSAVEILDEVWHFVAPGGQEEIEGLANVVRDPGEATTAEGARSKIRLWQQARKKGDRHGQSKLESV